MKCPRCQHENPQGARFCEECAAPLARTCSNCGTVLSALAKFCHACAHPTASGPRNTSTVSGELHRNTWPRRSSPPRAPPKASVSRSPVLFADLKGSEQTLRTIEAKGYQP